MMIEAFLFTAFAVLAYIVGRLAAEDMKFW